MPIVDTGQYQALLRAARAGGYALPAVSVANMIALTAAIEGFVQAGSDGIIQISPNAAGNLSGSAKDPILGATLMAEYARRLAEAHPVRIALHTDHCPPEKADSFLKPLIALTARRREAGLPALFSSHMFDASALPPAENLRLSADLARACAAAGLLFELEIGVVGGEEDGISGEGVAREKLYSTPGDMLAAYDAIAPLQPDFLLAATFGNVHGVYKPGHVRLEPKILRDGQAALKARHGASADFLFVFHGGSGSAKSEIEEALGYGVVKMNIDTDTQYAFTRPIADHMFRNYDGVLKIDGEVGRKKAYDPRAYLNPALAAMAARVVEACQDLKSVGRSLGLAQA